MAEERIKPKEEMEMYAWKDLVSRGTKQAVLGLSEFVGRDINIRALDLKKITASRASDLVGGADNEVVGIYLAMTGGATGHMMLIYTPDVALGLVDMLLLNEPGISTELGEIELSALGEIGNITGSFFLNSLADNTGMRLMPSPPMVMVDMAGAILNIALADIMQDRDDIFAMETVFCTEDQEINGTLLVLPTAAFLDVMLGQGSDDEVEM